MNTNSFATTHLDPKGGTRQQLRTTSNFKHMQTGAAVAKRKEEGLEVQEGSQEMLTAKLHSMTNQESHIAGVLCVRAYHFLNHDAYCDE